MEQTIRRNREALGLVYEYKADEEFYVGWMVTSNVEIWASTYATGKRVHIADGYVVGAERGVEQCEICI